MADIDNEMLTSQSERGLSLYLLSIYTDLSNLFPIKTTSLPYEGVNDSMEFCYNSALFPKKLRLQARSIFWFSPL